MLGSRMARLATRSALVAKRLSASQSCLPSAVQKIFQKASLVPAMKIGWVLVGNTRKGQMIEFEVPMRMGSSPVSPWLVIQWLIRCMPTSHSDRSSRWPRPGLWRAAAAHLAAAGAGPIHQADLGLDAGIVAGAGGVRAGLAVARDRGVDQSWI